ncbi:4'-phosphopantetheine phosphatase isoform X2 [Dermacentor andersoni]|uniref:4'-phosphopantetheine phosphatase isoform X2 n=1 Tax=Dermacentor andersoni TaxID=34620 RepID=UPI00215558E4|nr:4'-phosphopantetheine phosphatase-like isoform X2 [Dermacentor andersoni]
MPSTSAVPSSAMDNTAAAPSTTGTEVRRARSIQLPEQLAVFRNLKNAKRFAIDIGGSLTKIAYYSTVSHKRAVYNADFQKNGSCGGTEHDAGVPGGDARSEDGVPWEREVETGRLHFVKFETRHIEAWLRFVQEELLRGGSPPRLVGSVKLTGGGAFRHRQLIATTLGLSVDMEDELECLISGCNFLLKNITDEVFEYQRHGNPEYKFNNTDPNVFPYLLVNIGSGVSIMKVESDDEYERIGGSATGGGTFWGLGSLMTKAKSFDELLELAEQGDHRTVDMLVKDIYGGNYEAVGLTSDLIACSFGKTVRHTGNGSTTGKDDDDVTREFSESDIARSLLFMISNDIGQIASLYALMHGLDRAYFGGYFLRGHPLSMHTISFAINYWSKGKVRASFLRHEGYLGAIGAFLKGASEYGTQNCSWSENYAGSSGLQSPIPAQLSQHNSTMIDQLEMDRFEWQLVYCPLLADPAHYLADTVDLTQDAEARRYWLQCFQEAIDKFVEVAVRSQPHKTDAPLRASQFQQKYLCRLQNLQDHPFAYGSLTVRSLLDMREHCLLEFDFPDPYFQQKRMENEAALQLLPSRLSQLDAMGWRERQEALVTGLLAGNVFDWGAKEVARLLNSGSFGFSEAHCHLQERPWLQDDLDAWVERLEKGPVHKCAAIFVDNSGMDVLLGVLPFARELLSRGTKVLLCANTRPALNDVTHQELQILVQRVAESVCPRLREALVQGHLQVLDSGQSSPCLDLSRINVEVAMRMRELGTDLVVLEGMGRAVHTNLEARFCCEAIKAAVIKNHWLAQRLGGAMFSVIFRYETPESHQESAESTTSTSTSTMVSPQ